MSLTDNGEQITCPSRKQIVLDIAFSLDLPLVQDQTMMTTCIDNCTYYLYYCLKTAIVAHRPTL